MTYQAVSGVANPYLINGKIQDPGFTIAKMLLEKGLSVLYKTPDDIKESFEDMVNYINEDKAEDFVYELEDKNIHNVRFLTAGGYSWVSEDASQVIEYVKATEYDAEETYYKLEDGQYVEVQITAEDLNEYNVDDTITAENFEANKPLYIKIDLGETDGFTEINEFQSGLIYYKRNEDYDKYYIQVVTSAGEVPHIVERLKEIAESRKDCVFLADHNYMLGDESSDMELVLDCGKKVASEFGAMFSPWINYDNLGLLPASVGYLEAFANATINNPSWYAAAGRLRGKVTGEPKFKYTDKMCRKLALQVGEDASKWYDGVSVNAICERRGFGVVVWGNRTLFNGEKGDLLARSFLNIRQLCIDLQKRLYLQANAYMFEQNTDRMWFNFKSELIELLDNMKTGQGIEGYKIIKLPSQRRAQLRALVRVVPIEGIEEFDLTISLENSIVEAELA